VNDRPHFIAILGNDAFLAASPALPVQLMQAALSAGFDAVVPASLGDELVAGETLRLAQLKGRRPVVQCACPFALAQLCQREANLADMIIAVAPAAVALARALRRDANRAPHITYIGGCPGAQDPSIDLQVMPDAFLRGLQGKGIATSSQPEFFSDRIPPDRRRFLSMPGGAPRPQFVEATLRRTVVALDGTTNPMLSVADALFDGGATMIDPAGAYRCVCAGANRGLSIADSRHMITQHEPARALAAVCDAPAWLDLRPTVLPDDILIAPQASRAVIEGALTDPVPLGVHGAPPGASERQEQPLTSSNDAARRMCAPGVRSTRRRGANVPAPSATTEAMLNAHIPPTTRALHAQPLEREVPLIETHAVNADRFSAPRTFLTDARPG